MTNPVTLTPAQYNLLCHSGIAGILFADFDRNGTFDSSGLMVTIGNVADLHPEIRQEYLKRVIRPGAILLANLNINRSGAFSASTDRSTVLDSSDNEFDPATGDIDDLTLIKVRKPNPCSTTASRIVLRVHDADAQRIRIFPDAAATQPLLGRGKPAAAGPLNQHFLPTAPTALSVDFRVEAVTLTGDPRMLGPAYSSPAAGVPLTPALPYPVELPPGVSRDSALYPARLPGEVWIELAHQNSAGADQRPPYDVGVFTIAPFILQSNLQHPDMVYVCEIPDQSPVLPSGMQNWPGNIPFVEDLRRIISGLGVVLQTIPIADCRQFARDSTHAAILDAGGHQVFTGDQWAQDEFEIGYCWAPGNRWMHVVLHCRRSSLSPEADMGLARFVRRRLADAAMGLFVGIHDSDNSLNFGGNLEVSPPVTRATPALSAGAAGPAVPAHPPAPFGKILLGDTHTRPVNSDYRRFLQAQKVQPVLPVDTSWLAVGHVDEIFIFVNAPSRPSGAKPYVLLMAWPDVAMRLLQMVEHKPGVTNLFRTKIDVEPSGMGESVAAIITRYAPGTDPDRPLKTNPHQRKVEAIAQRMRRGLHLRGSDIIRIPVLYTEGLPRTFAYTPGMVNLLPIDDNVIIPKPWGPRVAVANAETVLLGVEGITSAMISAANLNSMRGEWYWARMGELLSGITTMFGAPASGVSATKIATDNTSAGLHAIGPTGHVTDWMVTDPWRRLWIWEDNVDIFEAYMEVQLRHLGLTVHFVDDWDWYHAGEGEIHCGTNARRLPPELTRSARWWDSYRELAEVPEYTV